MIDILLIRHPETDLAGTFCGHSDPPINANGQRQMKGLLDDLKRDRLEAVYGIYLRRAQTLAQAVASDHKVPCITSPALREIYFGEWESLTWSQIEETYPEEAAAWLAGFPHRPAPGGEAFPAFQSRVLNFIDQIIKAPLRCVAIVTHAGVLRTILTAYCNFDETTAASQTKAYCSLVRTSFGAVAR